MKAIIGGSGFYSLGGKKRRISTPYGKAIVYDLGEGYFIPRHGEKHSLPPFKVNYKANIYALKRLGVEELLTVHAVGIIKKYKPKDFVLAKDFIGLFTPITFYEKFDGELKHADVTKPFSKKINKEVKALGRKIGIRIKEGGVIATTKGNRFETKAEIKALAMMGANLVSMTHAYEATLSNEIGIEISSLCIGTNYAAGVSKHPLSHEEVVEVFESVKGKLIELAKAWIYR